MKLYMPTRVYNEVKCVENHSRELASLGKRALLVTGRQSSRQNGSLEDVCNALDREGILFVVFDGAEENPSVETVMSACTVGRSSGADFVVGIGGGSALDAAKAAALMLANPSRDASFLYAKTGSTQQPVYPAVPVAAVPTTAGTGSEVTPYAILTRSVLPEVELTVAPQMQEMHFPHLEKRVKQSISHTVFPTLALIDITYLKTMPRSSCVNTAVDTLAHLMESHLNTNSTDYSRIFSETGLRTFAGLKDRLLRYEIGDAQHMALMHACTLGGMAIAQTGTSLPHGLSYRITCEMDLPHGRAVGIFLPGFIMNYGAPEEAMKVLSLLDFGSVHTFCEYIRELLGEVRIEKDLWERTMDEVLGNPAKLKNYPFMTDREKLMQYLPVI